jgi:hypothetical protein
MLGSLMPSTMPWGANNVWSQWLTHVMKPAKNLALKKAAIVNESGQTVASTPGFALHPMEVKLLLLQFDKLNEMPDKRPPMVVVNDKTYLVKSANEHLIIAWNGKRYFIICRSSSLLLVALCQSKSKVDAAALWLSTVNKQLMDAHY